MGVSGKDLSDENFTVAYKDILSKMKYEDNHLLFDNNAILCLNEYTSNKRYYVNDTCVYNNKIYILSKKVYTDLWYILKL